MTQENQQIEKTYDPKNVEARLYEKWETGGMFTPARDESKQPFTIVMPPPNITGQLHIGHALDISIQDAIIRYKRMRGFSALFLPGTDHASIATEVKIVEQMAEEGVYKQDIGREAFLGRAWAWREQYGTRIVEQLKKLGASCDWSRERFTMDEGCSRAVVDVFVYLYEKGLIYQGDRIINWCPECKTALSDAEVEYEEDASFLWHVRYPTEDGGEGIVVATTRPETILGDTAVAVNPKDERYFHLHGKNVVLPLMNRVIPMITDDYVEQDFGSGAVKITPAHDPNDYEVGERHQLPRIRVMDDAGVMNENAGEFKGLDRMAARKKIVDALEELGLLVKVEPYTHNVGHCYRCHSVVEPILSKQWFVKMEPLAGPAIDVVRSGELQLVPPTFEKMYYNWMENVRDWCISRQLWWGHRIPAWYCIKCGKTHVAKSAPSCCSACGGALVQDEDVLDTWFSSALWPFSTLGWPEKTPDLDYFYPTNVLVTAYDIIFFWVARMIFSGLEYTGKKPFSHVLFHGIVRDGQGKKMSKSSGNGVDPLEIIDQYGADALRYSLLNGVAPGGDMRFYIERVEYGRNFCNKLWNATRFVLMNIDEKLPIDIDKTDIADRWILTRLNSAIDNIQQCMDRFDLGLALKQVHDFIWNEFCDWYIELAKTRLSAGDETVKGVLLYVLSGALQLLHPFMPFITEELYASLPGNEGESAMLSNAPQSLAQYNFELEAQQMNETIELVRGIRNIRAEMGVVPAIKTHITVVAPADRLEYFKQAEGYLQRLAYASTVEYATDTATLPQNTVTAISQTAQVYIPMGDLVDFAKEAQRLEKELANLEKEISRAQAKLGNEGFLAKAPEAIVNEERKKVIQFQETRDTVQARLERMRDML